MDAAGKPHGVLLRKMVKEDLPKVIRWNRDPELDKYMDGDYPRDLSEAEHLFWAERRHPGIQKFIIEAGGISIGDMEMVHIKWPAKEAEIRIRIGEKEYWNMGYGTTAVDILLEKAFREMGLEHIYLRVYDFNLRAIRCYEKCGFRKMGILRRSRPSARQKAWKNIVLMSVNKAVWSKRRRSGAQF
ncbi:MAG: GNAT family N-acetyltransferase [Bacillota bacterium]